MLERIHLEDVSSQGYCFQVDMARRAVEGGHRVVEVPITFVERVEGRSKMSRGIVLEALVRVTQWAARRRTQQAAGALRRLLGGRAGRPGRQD